MLLEVDKGFVTEPEDELAPLGVALTAALLDEVGETVPLWTLDD